VRPGADRPDEAGLRDRILSYLSADEQAAVARIADRVRLQASTDRLPDFKVMVAFGGGKDSAYVVAFVRAVQLHLARHTGSTFTLRVANMRHAGVPHAVMVNIDRTYRALGLLDDPRAELLTVDHAEVRPFHRDLPFPAEVRAMNRFDVLMNGHRTAGDGRPTFCNSCNLAVADFYGRVAWWGGGVDAIVTGDSRREQRHYSAWIMRLAARAGIDVGESRKLGFQGLLQVLSRLGDSNYRELFGVGWAA
jgi:hypothetical protein